MEKFWQCVVEGTSFSGYTYKTLKEAKAVAENLARIKAFAGRKIYILEAIECCQLSDLPITWDK